MTDPSRRRLTQLSHIHGDLSGADSDTEAVDEATSNEHADVLRSTDDDRADTPDDCTNLNGALAAKDIRKEATGDRTAERPARHGSSDATLHAGFGT